MYIKKSTTNISNYFKLGKKQHQLDFVDVKLDDDNEVFIDPRLIEFSSDPIIVRMGKDLKSYVAPLIRGIIMGKGKQVEYLLSGLEEPRETRLGYGHGNSNGNSVGPILKKDLIKSVNSNPAITSGKVTNWSDFELLIPQIDCDRISDMTTKIIKSNLIEFTQKECRKLGIPMAIVEQKQIFNSSTMKWETKKVELPVEILSGKLKPIIFVPKSIVRRKNDAKSNLGYFERYAMDHYLLKDKNIIFGLPKNGKSNSILKKDVRALIKSYGITRKKNYSIWISRYKNLLMDFRSYLATDKLRVLSDAEIAAIVY